jgi:hypothetical protein
MSEEAVAFAGRNQLDDPFPIVPDEDPVATIPPEKEDDAPDAKVAQNGARPETAGADDFPANGFPTGDFHDGGDLTAAPMIEAVLADDSQVFLQRLIGIATGDAQHGDDDISVLGITLAALGQALAEGEDEEQSFQDFVDALERRRPGEAALHRAAPLIAVFVARLASAAYRHEMTPDLAEKFVRAADEVAGAALQARGARTWRHLPEITVTIGQRAVHRGFSAAGLAEALPRLAARFGLGPRGPVMRVVSSPDQPRGKPSRGEAAGEPRRMVISGPVEIVILDR